MDNPGNPKQQLIDKLKGANNILVTVSSNPSVDQLATCIGLTLLLNKLDKHATAVFSGAVPSTLEFLQPTDTLEKNTDSLRDFIISLDKSKADKLRYKVEENVVKIFITPYRTSLTQDDLVFSQGDFNVDVVVALGVREQHDLDDAITAHGRILHDAVVTSINTTPDGGLGSINWHEPNASSLGEMVEDLSRAFDPDIVDAQIATALLTGIVAETERFSNEKTTPATMKASAELMGAGANQQLVATQLQKGTEEAEAAQPAEAPSEAEPQKPAPSPDGALAIDHHDDSEEKVKSQPTEETKDEQKEPSKPDENESEKNEQHEEKSNEENSRPLTMEPPTLGGTLTANTQPEGLDPAVNPLGEVPTQPILTRDKSAPLQPLNDDKAATVAPPEPSFAPPVNNIPLPEPPSAPLPQPAPSAEPPLPKVDDKETLTEIEESVHSSHVSPEDKLDEARDAVKEALAGGPVSDLPEPVADLNALPMGIDLHPEERPVPRNADVSPEAAHEVHIDENGNLMPLSELNAPEPINTPPAAEIHEPAPGQDLSPAARPLDMPLPPTFTPPPTPGPLPGAPPSGSTPDQPLTFDPTAPPPVPPPMMPPNFGVNPPASSDQNQ